MLNIRIDKYDTSTTTRPRQRQTHISNHTPSLRRHACVRRQVRCTCARAHAHVMIDRCFQLVTHAKRSPSMPANTHAHQPAALRRVSAIIFHVHFTNVKYSECFFECVCVWVVLLRPASHACVFYCVRLGVVWRAQLIRVDILSSMLRLPPPLPRSSKGPRDRAEGGSVGR